MRLSEICLLTPDVCRLAAFYRALLQLPDDQQDEGFQAILPNEPMLTILKQDVGEAPVHASASIAFTVEDIDGEYERLRALGMPIVQPPTRQPWGTVNMVLCDPDGNQVYLRQWAEPKE